MNPALAYLADHWLAALCLLLGTGLVAWAAVSRRRAGRWSTPRLVAGPALVCLGAGGLTPLPFVWALVVTGVSLGILAVLLAIVIASGLWWSPLAYLLGAGLLFGVGAAGLPALQSFAGEGALFVGSLEPLEPG